MESEEPNVSTENEMEFEESSASAGKVTDPRTENLYECLGEVIRDRRKALDLSQAELATGAGIDRAFLSNLERGQRKPSFGTVARIAKGLKLKYSRLVAQCEKCQDARKQSA